MGLSLPAVDADADGRNQGAPYMVRVGGPWPGRGHGARSGTTGDMGVHLRAHSSKETQLFSPDLRWVGPPSSKADGATRRRIGGDVMGCLTLWCVRTAELVTHEMASWSASKLPRTTHELVRRRVATRRAGPASDCGIRSNRIGYVARASVVRT